MPRLLGAIILTASPTRRHPPVGSPPRRDQMRGFERCLGSFKSNLLGAMKRAGLGAVLVDYKPLL